MTKEDFIKKFPDIKVQQFETETILSKQVHIPVDTRSAFPVISVHSPVSIQCRWQS